MHGARIEFFWDAVSPYTYLAATQIEAIAQRRQAELVWRPCLLGKVLEGSANQPPLANPAKRRYMFDDLARWARHYGVPLTPPQHFPASTLLVQRIGCALPDADVGPWAKATLGAYWGRGEDISQPEVLRGIIAGLGWNAEALQTAAQTPQAKDALKRNIDEALSRGAFGAPTFFVGEAMFWGNDRLPLLDAALAAG